MSLQKRFSDAMIAAANLLGEAAKRLPEGYELSLHCSNEESWIEMIHPSGDKMNDILDGDDSLWLQAIEACIEDEQDTRGEDEVDE